MSKNVTLRGIVVTGVSREEATSNFVAAAKGDSVSAHIDSENGFVVLSNAQTDETVFLNPLTGMPSLQPASNSVIKQLTFRSESSDNSDIPAFYTVCSSCFSHTIAEDQELAKHCVICASELKDLSETEIEALQKPETAQPTVGLMAVATDAKEAISKFRDLYEGKSDHKVYDCGNGNMVVASASDVLKFSPHNGVEVSVAEDVPFTASASSEDGITAHIFSCVSSSCGVHVVSSDDSPVFCPVCASGVIEPDEEDLEEDEEEDDSESEEEEDSDSDEEEDYDEEEDEDFESESANVVISSSTSAVGIEQAQQAKADDKPIDNKVDNMPNAADAQIANASSEPAAVAAQPEIKEVIKEVVVTKEVPVEQTVIATNLLDMVATAGELDADALTLVIATNVDRDTKWVAFHKDTPIATASARTTKHLDIFGTPAFGNVVIAAARNDGVREALNEFGFTGIATEVAVDTYVKQSVEDQVSAQVSEASSRYEADHNDFADRFQCALATSARAIDIGYYQDVSHPVKDRLLATFSQLGVKNAGELINAAFASSSDEYVQLLVDKARDVMSYDVQVQNDFTKVVASASKTSGALTFGKPVAEPEQKQMTSVSSSTKVPAPNDLIQAAVSSLRFSTRKS